MKPSIAGDAEGSTAKRGRDGAASAVAAKAAELSGDDRFSLSKFQLDERFKGRSRASAAAAAEVDESEESEEEEEVVAEEEEHSEDSDIDEVNYALNDDDDDDSDNDDDGNYVLGIDDDEYDDEDASSAGPAERAAAKSKKLAKKLKPMSPEELAAFMKVAASPRLFAHSACLIRVCYLQEQERRGVVYLSRIPPYMKPMKVPAPQPV